MELRELGITNNQTLSALETIPRDLFISSTFKDQAYENIALPIEKEQTISQPFIVALMTQNLELNKKHKVLELGTGSGYQTAILAKLSRRVYTIERIKALLEKSQKIFMKLNINNIVTKLGDGNKGWIEQKPFDRIIITAATKNISLEIIDQTKEGSIIVAPIIINNKKQILRKFTRVKNKLLEEDITEVSFVPNISGVSV
tara:strand:+ start:3888 stop:4490 length:603 start_codon:yes stop_codon:yes gene_type:complete